MSDRDSWNDEPYLIPETLDNNRLPQNEVHQLQQEVRQQQARVGTLQVLLADAYELLEEKALRRDLLGLELELHQEALREKLREVKELACMIETQNGLLGLAWADSQHAASSRRKRGGNSMLLHGYVEEMFATEEAEAHVSKKRKLGP